ncbi:methyltransferase domain-containing protein [uncultured Bilophila sp.]|nr:methyltransferase domain-containing protein [uncultured Bilophila sp.]
MRRGDASRLPYAAGAFDLVTAFETVSFWPDVPAAFVEVRRVARPARC